MIGISKLAKFPLEYSKGTVSERISLAKKLNAEFFEKISKKFKSGEVSFDTFQRTLKETIPVKSSVKVKKTETGLDCYGYTSFKSKHNNSKYKLNINSWEIHLPENKNGKISLDAIDTCLHETYHYFSQMAAPKEPRRIAKLLETGTYDRFSKVYSLLFYSDFPFDRVVLGETLDRTLAKLNIEEKIDFLQYCRYSLGNEANAFAEGKKYSDLAEKLFGDKLSIQIKERDTKSFNFDMKLELLNNKLSQIMKKYRQMKN